MILTSWQLNFMMSPLAMKLSPNLRIKTSATSQCAQNGLLPLLGQLSSLSTRRHQAMVTSIVLPPQLSCTVARTNAPSPITSNLTTSFVPPTTPSRSSSNTSLGLVHQPSPHSATLNLHHSNSPTPVLPLQGLSKSSP